jgi:tripartite-type tricarboxylate transporter receptor subunit TctC
MTLARPCAIGEAAPARERNRDGTSAGYTRSPQLITKPREKVMRIIKRFPVPGRTVVAALLGVSTFVFVATNDAVAQKWPDKTVRIVLPFSPGGGGDTFARMVAGRLSETLSQQFVVENRPGAGSTLGTEHVAKAAPDGYTFLMTSASFVFTPGLYSKLRFDPVNDFTRVSQVASVPFVIAVLPSLPVKDLRDLVARAQSKPGGVLYASAGPGSAMHLAGALFGMVTQSQLTHVPYKGGGATVVAVMGGEATVAFYTIETVLPHIRANRMRALAVSTRDRAVALPDVPTAIENGIQGLRGCRLVRNDGACGHTAGDRRRAERRSIQSDGESRVEKPHDGIGRHPVRDHARRVRSVRAQ